MQLSKRQKKVVELIGDERFTVEIVERYYKEDPLTMGGGRRPNISFYVRMVNDVNSFMKAVNGFLKILDESFEENA